jgi:hypothetical protein
VNASRRERLWAAGGAAAVAAFALREALFGGRALFERDLETLFYGRAEVLRRSVAEGVLPLWNPYPAFGEPLLALGVTQVLYPPAWLALVLPPHVAWALSAALHLAFTGLGLFLLARRLGLSTAASGLAAAAWAGGDALLSAVNMPNLLTGAAWLPWAGLAAIRLDAARGPLWLAAALAAPLLAGSPEAFLMCAATALAGAGLAASRADAGRRLARLGLAAGLGLALAAVQWVPTLALAQRSARATLGDRAQAYWSQHPAGLATLALPVVLDELPLAEPWRRALYENREPFLPSIYVGALVLPLALVGLVSAPRRPRFALAALALGATAVALGRHLPAFDLWSGLPGLASLRFPSKALELAAFALALLAGFGLDAVRRAEAARVRPAAAAAMAALGLLALWAAQPGAGAWHALLVPPETLGHPWTRSAAFLATLRALAVAGAAALAGAALVLRADRRRAALALAALAALEAVASVDGLNATASAEAFAWRTPALGPVPAQRPNRVYAIDYPDTESLRLLGRDSYRTVPLDAAPDARLLLGRLYPVADLGAGALGREGFPLDVPQLRSAELTRWLRSLERNLATPAFPRLLQLSGADFLLSLHAPGPGFAPLAEARGVHETVKLWRVEGALPRAFAVAGVRLAEGQAAFDALVSPSFDPLAEVVLAPGASVAPAPGATAGEVRALELGLDRFALEATLARPGLVVLLEAWDPGWVATVDGAPAAVLRANLVFRAVAVPAGRHRVEMRYRPREVLHGLVVSALAMAALVALAFGRAPALPGAPARG